mgnify:FL=1|jgi:hypothetical protein
MTIDERIKKVLADIVMNNIVLQQKLDSTVEGLCPDCKGKLNSTPKQPSAIVVEEPYKGPDGGG